MITEGTCTTSEDKTWDLVKGSRLLKVNGTGCVPAPLTGYFISQIMSHTIRSAIKIHIPMENIPKTLLARI